MIWSGFSRSTVRAQVSHYKPVGRIPLELFWSNLSTWSGLLSESPGFQMLPRNIPANRVILNTLSIGNFQLFYFQMLSAPDDFLGFKTFSLSFPVVRLPLVMCQWDSGHLWLLLPGFLIDFICAFVLSSVPLFCRALICSNYSRIARCQ